MYKTFKEAVEAGNLSNELAEALSKGVYSENQEEIATLRDEAKTQRLEKEGVIKSFNEVTKTKDDLLVKVADIDKQIADAKAEGKADTVKVLEQEREAHKKLSGELASFEQENTRLRINSAVSNELNKFKVKSDLRGDAETVLAGMTRIDDGQLLFGADGASLEDGVKTYFDSRKSYLDAQGAGGSGNESGGGSSVPKGDMGGSTTERTAAIQAMIDAGK